MSSQVEVGMNACTEVNDLAVSSSNAERLKRPAKGDTDAPPKKKIATDANFFSDFSYLRTLNDDTQKKMTVVLGQFAGSEDSAIVVLERKPFSESDLSGILCEQSRANLVINNYIYSTRELFPLEKYSGIKTSLIYPATEKHIAKYTKQESRLICESADDYNKITLLYISSSQFSTTWVDNILEKKTESERIVFEDPDAKTGFILLPDMKWDGKQVEDLYLMAVCHQKGIRSLRELTSEHLPLLRNILDKGRKAIEAKYCLESSQLRIYLHYQPSCYHLHVHFTHVRYDAPGIQVERAHLLTDVIQNIELCSDYYRRASLTFPVQVTDKLYSAFEEARKSQDQV